MVYLFAKADAFQGMAPLRPGQVNAFCLLAFAAVCSASVIAPAQAQAHLNSVPHFKQPSSSLVEVGKKQRSFDEHRCDVQSEARLSIEDFLKTREMCFHATQNREP